MTGGARILTSDWEAFRSAFPGADQRELKDEVMRRGREILARAALGHRQTGSLERGRDELARKAASVALLRFELVTQRTRFARAEALERKTYERHLELDRDVVPPLKLEAKRLRAELRSLEARARSLGVDVEALEPRIDWPNTIAVDTYEPPRYESNEQRRKAAVEFFRRVGGA
jgi:hypothetical protein